MKVIEGSKHIIKNWASDLEPEAETQAKNLASLPFIYKHVALMPDAHAGRGSTVGSVIATKGAIIPAAVGVDIGCGMLAVKLPFSVEKLGSSSRLKELRHSIERDIPLGKTSNNKLSDTANSSFTALGETQVKLSERVLGVAAHQVGSLGGGNHFIEICKDQNDNAWVMLHSGSRHIGKYLADIHINKAKDLMKQYFISLPDPELAYLAQNTPEFNSYIKDLKWAQQYAFINREEMRRRVLKNVSFHVYGDARLLETIFEVDVSCHHNYTSMEHHYGQNIWVTRKGAVSAKTGELGIIPGSMGAKSYIVEGLGNQESFCSCSHGAGRKMSRTKAKAQFTQEDLINQTSGIECRKDSDVIDEIPGSYKDIDIVMANQADLVKPIYTLNQLICIKGN